jgi:hypothetical protein
LRKRDCYSHWQGEDKMKKVRAELAISYTPSANWYVVHALVPQDQIFGGNSYPIFNGKIRACKLVKNLLESGQLLITVPVDIFYSGSLIAQKRLSVGGSFGVRWQE